MSVKVSVQQFDLLSMMNISLRVYMYDFVMLIMVIITVTKCM